MDIDDIEPEVIADFEPEMEAVLEEIPDQMEVLSIEHEVPDDARDVIFRGLNGQWCFIGTPVLVDSVEDVQDSSMTVTKWPEGFQHWTAVASCLGAQRRFLFVRTDDPAEDIGRVVIAVKPTPEVDSVAFRRHFGEHMETIATYDQVREWLERAMECSR